MERLVKIRNIGISAHIDSGKTTLTERMLYYAGKIHRMREVHDEDGGATMDYMDLEKERGITITSAATTIEWNDHQINIIDTPGHVDFTIEVERSLRVLDGAVLVLCAVGGVQSQTLTVDRQMKRYRVPRIAFINKMDRIGADPARVLAEMESKLGHVAVPLQIPVGIGETFDGHIDLVSMKRVYFEGANGEDVRVDEIPAELREEAERARNGMLDALSLYDDELLHAMLEHEQVDETQIHAAVRRATIAREITPVFFGSAYRNRGVQRLLDAVTRYMPSPLDRMAYAGNHHNEGAEIAVTADPDAPAVAMAFKIVDEPFGQLTYVRVYQGRLARGGSYLNARIGRKQRITRLVRMHANHRENLDEAVAGDIVAVMGVDCVSGDTLCDLSIHVSLERIAISEPVISLAVRPVSTKDRDAISRALHRFMKEDPTFHVRFDEQTGETIISGMGELHLDIYIERTRREYGAQLEVGAPRVNYKEAPGVEVEFNHRHKKQTGGSGQYAHVVGRLVPQTDDAATDYEFENGVTGGRIPTEYIPSVDKGFQMARGKGPLAGFEIVRVKMVLEDGSSHAVDSSDLAFQICARDAFRDAFLRSRPILLEPIMRVEVEVPSEHQGSVTGDLCARRAIITSSETRTGTTVIATEAPLAEMFGYSTKLRSLTQGRGTFSMEFAAYRRMPSQIQEEVVAAAREAQQSRSK
jgi:elongation factor G